MAITKEPREPHTKRVKPGTELLTNLDCLTTEVALVRIAESIRDLRRLRRNQFGLHIEEPAWDMLVELYIRDSRGVSTTASQLTDAAFFPASTAERWLRFLEREGWVSGKPHPTDARTEFVELTDGAKESLDRYLSNIRSVAAQQVASTKTR